MKPPKNGRIKYFCNFLANELAVSEINRLLLKVGIDRSKLETADISPFQEAELFRQSSKMLNDPTVAARAGSAVGPVVTISAYIAKSSATLREATRNISNFYSLSDPSIEVVLHNEPKHAVIELKCQDGELLKYRRFQEFRVFGLLARIRNMTGINVYPERYCLQHALGDTHPDFERVARCTVLPEAGFNGAVLNPSVLDLELPGHDPVLVEYLSDLANEQLEKSGQSRYAFRKKVENELIKSLPGLIPSADVVADALGVSRRTLTRKLKDERTTFREIVDALRYDLSKSYLSDGLSVGEIAYYLGYADHAAFSTAFKRWSGKSPKGYQDNDEETLN